VSEFEPDEGTEEPDEAEEETETAGEPAPEEEGDSAEQEQQPAEPSEPDALARITEIDKKLEGLRKHVATRMGVILGEDAQYYVEDPISRWSGVPGWMPPIDLPPDVAAELYHLLGMRSPTDLLPDPHSMECDECGGEGVNLTKSKVQGQTELPCVKCETRGWLPTDDARRAKGATVTNGLAPSYPPPSPVASAVPETQPDEDPRAVELRQLGYAVIPPYVTAS
jgi:hypothetical protein